MLEHGVKSELSYEYLKNLLFFSIEFEKNGEEQISFSEKDIEYIASGRGFQSFSKDPLSKLVGAVICFLYVDSIKDKYVSLAHWLTSYFRWRNQIFKGVNKNNESICKANREIASLEAIKFIKGKNPYFPDIKEFWKRFKEMEHENNDHKKNHVDTIKDMDNIKMSNIDIYKVLNIVSSIIESSFTRSDYFTEELLSDLFGQELFNRKFSGKEDMRNVIKNSV